MDYNELIYEPAKLINYYNSNYNLKGNAKWFPTWTRNYNYFVTMQWNKEITKDHKITTMIGNEYQKGLPVDRSCKVPRDRLVERK